MSSRFPDTQEHRPRQVEHDRQAMIGWEALMALERLQRHLRIDTEPVRNRARILRTVGKLLGARSLAWVSMQGDGDVLLEGEPLFSPCECGQLATHLADQTRGEELGYVLDNEPRKSGWGPRYPRILNLLAVPIAERSTSGLAAGVQQDLEPPAVRATNGQTTGRQHSSDGN